MSTVLEFRKCRVYFFGNEEQKKFFFSMCVNPFFKERKNEQFFAVRDWNGGPNVEIIYTGDPIKKQELKSAVKEFVTKNNILISDEEIKENLKSYEKNQTNIALMEKKQQIPIDAKNHLMITDRKLEMSYYRKVYNSYKHMQVHFESRFLLQNLISETLDLGLPEEEFNLILIKMFLIVLSQYEYGEKFASMVFFSNLMGVYAVADQYQKKQAFQNYFETQIQKYDLSRLDTGFGYDELMNRYRLVWEKIYEKCTDLVDGNHLSEKGFYQLEDQEKQMIQNINPLESDFHKQMLLSDDLHKMVSSRTHLIFRSMTNILYNIMPSLQVSFLQKNFCIYATLEYIKQKYHTDWDEIMKERQIS